MNYDEVFTYENLFEAHMNARKCKRGKKDVIDFENNLSFNLWSLRIALRERKYTIFGYNKFVIYEPKKREIQALEYKDRIVQHALCDLYLYPLLTKKFIYDNGACQKGKGTDFALDRLTQFFCKFYKKHGKNGYILKADIKQFFPSIDHEVLKEKLKRVINDNDMLKLLNMIVDSYNAGEGKGIPMGNQTSQLFALYYLDSMDRLIKEKMRVKYYVRYMDDMILIHEDKEYLKEVLKNMRAEAESLKLEFNSKTQIFPIKNGVDFLGFHFYVSDTGKVIKKLRTSSKKRYKKKMKNLRDAYNSGKIELEDVQKSLPGFKGHLKRGHTYNLQKAVLNDFVLKRNSKG